MSKKRRILLIDDEPATSYMIAMILKLNDFDVVPYSDPELALSSFDSGLYDLILIDVKMSGMNGFDLYKKMREIDDRVKVCFMTDRKAVNLEEFTTLFPNLAPTSFLEKPVTSKDLLEILRRNLVDIK